MDYKVKNNDETTPVETITEQLQELRPLPLGMKEFEDFFARIWSGALITGEPGKEEDLILSAKNVIANEIIHLPSGQTHERDIYFINRMRKVAANQVCLSVIEKTKAELSARIKARQEQDTSKNA